MPELPEVETVKRTLNPLLGKTVQGVWTSRLKLRKDVSTQKLKQLFLSKTITKINRLGKYLLICFGDSEQGLLIHLGMSGRLRLFKKDDSKAKHTHMVLELSRDVELRYSDPRRFGIIDVFSINSPNKNKFLAKLGKDALNNPIGAEEFYEQTKNRRINIKSLLLNQSILCGIGNIYASEALWIAKIHPSTIACALSKDDLKRLLDGIRDTLENALDKGGTSLRDFVNADGHQGENIHYLHVYGKTNEPCPRCAKPLGSLKISNRSTYLCEVCQKQKQLPKILHS